MANAGQASWQRPHSVHEKVSSTCFQVRSFGWPAPKRSSSSGTSGSSNLQRLEPAPGAGAPEPHVDRRDEDVQVLGARQVGEEGQDRQHVDPDEHPLEHPRRLVVGEQVRERVRHRRPRRRPLVQVQRDPGRVPEQQADHDRRDQGQDQVGLAEMAALEALRPLDLADPAAPRSRPRARARRRRRRAARTSPDGRATAASSACRRSRSSRSGSSGRAPGSPRR